MCVPARGNPHYPLAWTGCTLCITFFLLLLNEIRACHARSRKKINTAQGSSCNLATQQKHELRVATFPIPIFSQEDLLIDKTIRSRSIVRKYSQEKQ